MTTEPDPKSMEVKQNTDTTAKDEEEVAEIRRSEKEEQQELRRSERTRKTPVRYSYDEYADTKWSCCRVESGYGCRVQFSD